MVRAVRDYHLKPRIPKSIGIIIAADTSQNGQHNKSISSILHSPFLFFGKSAGDQVVFPGHF